MKTVRQTTLFGPCEKKSKKVVRKEQARSDWSGQSGHGLTTFGPLTFY